MKIPMPLFATLLSIYSFGANAETYTFDESIGNPLDLQLPLFECDGVQMFQFGRDLNRLSGISVGMVIAEKDQSREFRRSSVTIRADGWTPRELLDEAVLQNEIYSWVQVGPTSIDILPLIDVNDATKPLNVTFDYSTNGPVSLSRAIVDANRLRQEVGYYRNNFSISGGNVIPDPVVDVELRQVNLIQLMNAIFESAGPKHNWEMSTSAIQRGYMNYATCEFKCLETAREVTANSELLPTVKIGAYKDCIAELPYPELRAVAWFELAELYNQELKMPEEALAIYRSLLPTMEERSDYRISGLNFDILRGFRQACAALDCRDYCMKELRTFYEDDRYQDSVSRSGLAYVMTDLAFSYGNYDVAIRELKELKALYPNDAVLCKVVDDRIELKKTFKRRRELKARRN